MCSSPVQLEFDCQNGAVNILGLNDEVAIIENIIWDKYLGVLCNSTYEITTPCKSSSCLYFSDRYFQTIAFKPYAGNLPQLSIVVLNVISVLLSLTIINS